MSITSNMHAIELQNVTKTYRIYPSPFHRLKEILFRKKLHSDFTVLNDLSFDVGKGETFGIIGENGSGKSTLLKIAADTLKPTKGEVRRKGRVSALLELGAGFNPELTGEENIFLNAYLLGLTKPEIEAKKQDIIDFSELGEFILRPVKTYSSGMHVRLAFSIATSVNPDILIVDEALAVGDQHFQKKCVDRMMEFKRGGKTILFCSHALYLVQELCDRTVWLQNGAIAKIGHTPKVINAYTDWVREKEAGMKVAEAGMEVAEEAPSLVEQPRAEKPVSIEAIRMTTGDGGEVETLKTGQDIILRIKMRIAVSSERYTGHIGAALIRNDEETVYGSTTKIDGLGPIAFRDRQEVGLRFRSLPLLSGQYCFLAAIIDEHAIHPYDIQRTRMFSVENFSGELGVARLYHEWEMEKSDPVPHAGTT